MHLYRTIICSIFIICLASFAQGQQPLYQWANAFGGSHNDFGSDILADANGNVYLVGTVRGTVDLDPGVGTFMVTADTLGGKLFLSKFDASGNFLWADVWDKGIYDTPYTLDFFPNGDILLTSYYDFQVDMDPGPGTYLLNAGSNLNYFALRLSPAGNFVWVKEFGGVYNTPLCYSELDSAGNIYIAGFFSHTRDFDPGLGVFSMTATGRDIFIMKLSSAGNFMWAKQTTGTLNNWVNDIALSPSNEMVITGSFSGTTDFDPGPGVASFTAGTTISSEDFFVAKYSSSGVFMWVDHFNANSSFTRPGGLETDSNGMIYLAGHCSAITDLDPDTVSTYMPATTRYLLKLNPDGTFYNATEFSNKMYLRNMEIDSWNNVYLSGSYSDTLDVDPGAGVYNLVTDSVGFGNFMIALDSTSNLLWADGLGGYFHYGAQMNIGCAMYADAQGNLFFTGRFEDHQLNFGPYQVQNATPWTYNYTDCFFGKIESITSGISENEMAENGMWVYPNPAADYINLKSNKRIFEIFITDATGKTIASTEVNDYALQHYDISGLPHGMYFIQIFYDDGTRVTGKFIRN